MKQPLVGQDPFDNETLGHQMRYTNGAANNWRDVGCIEIALWDIVGKVAGQPLYKPWGAYQDRVPAAVGDDRACGRSSRCAWPIINCSSPITVAASSARLPSCT